MKIKPTTAAGVLGLFGAAIAGALYWRSRPKPQAPIPQAPAPSIPSPKPAPIAPTLETLTGAAQSLSSLFSVGSQFVGQIQGLGIHL